MPWKSKNEGLETADSLDMFRDRISAAFRRTYDDDSWVKEVYEDDKYIIASINEELWKFSFSENDGEYEFNKIGKVEEDRTYNLEAADPQWIEIGTVGEHEWKGELPDGVKNLPDFEKRFIEKGGKPYLVLDEAYLRDMMDKTLPYMRDPKKLQELTGLTGIRMFRQGNGEHEFTQDGSFAVYRDMKFENGALLGYAEFSPDASKVLSSTGQIKQSMHATEIGGIYPFLLCTTATDSPRVNNVAEMKLSEDGIIVNLDGADGGQADSESNSDSEPIIERTNMEKEIADLKATLAERDKTIADLKAEMESLKAAETKKTEDAEEKAKVEAAKVEAAKAEAATPKVITEDDLPAIKAAWERDKKITDSQAAIEASIVPALRESLHKVITEKPETGELVLSEKCTVDVKDERARLMAAIDMIREYEIETGIPAWPKLELGNQKIGEKNVDDSEKIGDEMVKSINAKRGK